jgi:long-chain acyl-CoA synthetase
VSDVLHRLVDGIETWAADTPAAVAVIDGDRQVRYGDLRSRMRLVAAALRRDGIGKAGRIAYLGKNSAEQIELTAGAAALGALVVPLNWRLSAGEVARIVDHMDARLVLVQDELTGLWHDVARELGSEVPVLVTGAALIDGATSYDKWLADVAPMDPADFTPLGPDDIAAQLYTSGTSGSPKGVMLSERGLESTVALLKDIWALDTDAVLMPILPWFHVGGIGAACGALFWGGRIVAQNEINGAELVDAIERHGVTAISTAPVMMQMILEDARPRGIALKSLAVVSYGASPITQALLRDFVAQAPHTNVLQIYGLTETWGTVTRLDNDAHRDDAHPERLQSAGKPIAGLTMRIIDPHTREDVPTGEIGEIWVKYAGNMLGYYKSPEQSAEVLMDDGWLRTNDMGRLDDEGFLYLTDRVNDMIVSGGENIFPTEVEDVIRRHPQVADVGIVGIPHEKWGETPMAFVVPVEGQALDERSVIEFTRDNLAHYKCPTRVAVIDALPRNPSGKLLRRVLRDRVPEDS